MWSKYQQSGYETDDLLSVGTIGLIKAVNTFNAEKGSRLATYAVKCVENEILMMFRSGKKVLQGKSPSMTRSVRIKTGRR